MSAEKGNSFYVPFMHEMLQEERDGAIHDVLANPLAELITCDIRDFDSPRRFDVILLHGPMYHIVGRDDRISVLAKCSSLLSPDGILLVFAINRYAGYFYGVRSGDIMKAAYRRLVFSELQSGIRSRDPGWYFHTAEELQTECDEAGLNVFAKKSVVTQAWMLPDAEERIHDPEYVEQLMSLARDAEDHLSIGQDMLFATRRKRDPNQPSEGTR